MLIKIDDASTIAELQERFSECFPGLKIEFFKEPHHWQEPSGEREILLPSCTVGEIRKKHDPGILEVKSTYQTGRVEQDFKKLFGLNVQVFRWDKDAWHQTGTSDKLTLKQQQELAAGTGNQ